MGEGLLRLTDLVEYHQGAKADMCRPSGQFCYGRTALFYLFLGVKVWTFTKSSTPPSTSAATNIPAAASSWGQAPAARPCWPTLSWGAATTAATASSASRATT